MSRHRVEPEAVAKPNGRTMAMKTPRHSASQEAAASVVKPKRKRQRVSDKARTELAIMLKKLQKETTLSLQPHLFRHVVRGCLENVQKGHLQMDGLARFCLQMQMEGYMLKLFQEAYKLSQDVRKTPTLMKRDLQAVLPPIPKE